MVYAIKKWGVISLLFLGVHGYIYAQFPYLNSMVSQDDFSQFTTAAATQVSFTSYGAELTNKENQIKGFFLNDLVLASGQGFTISFDYIMTGKKPQNNNEPGEGLALVLFDGLNNQPSIGAKGSAFGYSYAATTSGNAVEGLTHGFLAVGIDLYGNFKARREERTEYRNGVRTATKEMNHLTIRGPGGVNGGYPVLISQSVSDSNQRYRLNPSNGDYEMDFDAPDATTFSFKLRENESSNESDLAATLGHPSYRKVKVRVIPKKQGDNLMGIYVNVEVVHGRENSRIINDYFIANNTYLGFKEAIGQTRDLYILRMIDIPSTLKLGFTGATSSAYQKMYVRNLNVSLPFSPLVDDVIIEQGCKDDLTSIDVLARSIGFNSSAYTPGGDFYTSGQQGYLDPFSFQFAMLVDGEFLNTPEPFVAVTTSGRYEYDPDTLKVFFIPNAILPSTKDEVYFTIKNKRQDNERTDLDAERYRSSIARIQLNFTHNCNDIIMINGTSL